MARKSRDGGSAEPASGAVGGANATANPYERMASTWSQLTDRMGSQMNDMMSDGKTRYGDLSSKWMKFYEDVANNMTKSVEDGNKAEIQVVSNVWKNYNTRLLNRMNKIIEDGTGAQDQWQKTWQTYVPKISEQLTKSTQGRPEEVQVNDLFQSWTDFSTRMSQGVLSLIDTTVSDGQELVAMWNALNAEMKGLIEGTVSSNNDAVVELRKNWDEASERMGTEMSKFMEDYGKRYSQIRDSWTDWSSEMSKELMDATMPSGPDFEELYRNYIERTNQFLSMLNPAMASTASATSAEMKELRKRIEELEKRLDESRAK